MTWNPFHARREHGLRRIAEVMLAAPADRYYGWELSRAAHISSGTMYPLLTRMLADGWLSDDWEKPPPVNRPPRRYYMLTDLGRRELEARLQTGGSNP